MAAQSKDAKQHQKSKTSKVNDAKVAKPQKEKGKKTFTCTHPRCGSVFASKRALQRHMSGHMLTCRWKVGNGHCGQPFGTSKELCKHLREHCDAVSPKRLIIPGGAPYTCQWLGCQSKGKHERPDALNLHLREHNHRD